MSAPRKTAAKKTAAKKTVAKKTVARKTVARKTAPKALPALTKARTARKLRSEETVLDNGLRVVAVRKPGIPVVEMRLRMPFLSAKAGHSARAELLAETLPTGAGGLDRVAIAETVQGLGASLGTGVDADRLVLSGNVLSTNLAKLLEVAAKLLTDPAYAKDEVSIERDRLVESLGMARARAGVVAGEALDRRMFGDHPYARDLPLPEDVAAVTSTQLANLHRKFVQPDRAALILVGDLPPAKLIEHANTAFAGWTGTAKNPKVPALPTPPAGPLLIIDRPGSVQTSVRMGALGLPRDDPRYPALQLANLIFGGYFSSRWTENIREDKGYTYGPHSRVGHHTLGSTVSLDVEVATEVTAPALLETAYELGRIASLPVTPAEVESVRQYAIGTLALSTATQAGLASTLSGLSAFGLGLDWLRDHPARLTAATVEDVSAAAAQFFAPSAFTSVVVGDAATIAGPLAALGPVEQA